MIIFYDVFHLQNFILHGYSPLPEFVFSVLDYFVSCCCNPLRCRNEYGIIFIKPGDDLYRRSVCDSECYIKCAQLPVLFHINEWIVAAVVLNCAHRQSQYIRGTGFQNFCFCTHPDFDGTVLRDRNGCGEVGDSVCVCPHTGNFGNRSCDIFGKSVNCDGRLHAFGDGRKVIFVYFYIQLQVGIINEFQSAPLRELVRFR